MDLDTLCLYLLDKSGAEETFPFDEDTLVVKVQNKMFALVALERIPPHLTLKCDPARSLTLRDRYAAIQPGYHMNKRHWLTLVLDGSLPAALVQELIDHSYERVVAGLPKAQRQVLLERS